MAAPLPSFTPMPAAQASSGPSGWQGIQGLMALLQGGLNQSQMSNLQSGYTGGNGYAVGGAHGAFSGLSPWAVNFLSSQQGLFSGSHTMASQPLTNPDGTPLTGSSLLMAQIHNSLAGNSPMQYKLADGITAGDIQSMLGDYAASSGHSAYAKGDDANGAAPTPPRVVTGNMGHPWDAPSGVAGYGKKGNAFHSAAAAKAAGRFHKGGPQLKVGARR